MQHNRPSDIPTQPSNIIRIRKCPYTLMEIEAILIPRNKSIKYIAFPEMYLTQYI